MSDLVERLAKLSERGEVEHREIVMNLLIDASAEISRLRDDNDRLRRGLMGAAVFAKPDAEITRLRALNAELVEALEACPLPSTMGNVKTHYGQFYDWYHKHVEKHTPFPRKR